MAELPRRITGASTSTRSRAEQGANLLLGLRSNRKRAVVLLQLPLHRAAFLGDLDLVDRLIKAGECLNGALHEAIKCSDERVVDRLVQERGNLGDRIDHNGVCPIHLAVHLCREDILRTLLRRGVDKDVVGLNGLRPLSLAISEGHVGIAEVLLKGGAYIGDRVLSLSMSARHKDGRMVKLLLDQGADASAATVWGKAPLLEAALHNSPGGIDALVEAGADVNWRDPMDRTSILTFAIIHRSHDAVLALLRNGVGVDYATRDAWETPLQYAVCNTGYEGSWKAVDLLLRWGEDETRIDKEGQNLADNIAICYEDEIPCIPLPEEIERVRWLLANATLDRAWRRRGFLVMCRAFPNRISLNAPLGSQNREAVQLPNAKTARTTSEAGGVGIVHHPKGKGIIGTGGVGVVEEAARKGGDLASVVL